MEKKLLQNIQTQHFARFVVKKIYFPRQPSYLLLICQHNIYRIILVKGFISHIYTGVYFFLQLVKKKNTRLSKYLQEEGEMLKNTVLVCEGVGCEHLQFFIVHNFSLILNNNNKKNTISFQIIYLYVHLVFVCYLGILFSCMKQFPSYFFYRDLHFSRDFFKKELKYYSLPFHTTGK